MATIVLFERMSGRKRCSRGGNGVCGLKSVDNHKSGVTKSVEAD